MALASNTSLNGPGVLSLAAANARLNCSYMASSSKSLVCVSHVPCSGSSRSAGGAS